MTWLPKLLLLGLALSCHVTLANSRCPWDDPSLEKWSEASTWPDNKIPRLIDDVTIPAGKKILLDTEIPRLKTLTINGTLVWGNVDNIRLLSCYILVNGEFHIGSEDCRFEKNAEIFLYGRSNSKVRFGGFGTKFLGAAAGSKLEIHGKEKKSWTKLIATVNRLTPRSCGVFYDSANSTVRKRNGLWMQAWISDGSFLSLDTFDMSVTNAKRSITLIVNKINAFPNGTKISLAVQKSLGRATGDYEALITALQSLGARKIRPVWENEAYVLIAEKGERRTAKEKYVKRPPWENGVLEASVTFTQGNLIYHASSFSELGRRNHEVNFRVLSEDAAYPKLSLLHDVTSWQPGDEIVLASTDYNWRQAEVRTIVSCSDCAPNQVRVKGALRYTHFGEVTFGVDERGEVGLLSRNIRIDGELQHKCYSYDVLEEKLCDIYKRDTYGGHTKVVRNAWARIEGVQLTNMGQQSTMATYPLHFHMADAVQGQYLRNNSIRDSNSRCITVHTTDYLEVSDNVCYMHLGHGIFLEDSAEQNNTIHRNLVIGTQFGTLLFTDMTASNDMCPNRDFCELLSSIWITHPNNYITENVAAGSDNFGIVFTFSDRPLQSSKARLESRGLYRDKSTRYTKVREFSKNVMHSNKLAGLWFDSRLSYGEPKNKRLFVPENGKVGMNRYNPREPPNENGILVETVLSQLTLYKNEDRNTWIRGGNIVITNSTFADSLASYVAAHSVDDTYAAVRHSIFIGETENKGEPYTHVFYDKRFSHLPKPQQPQHHFDRSIARGRPDFIRSGVMFYQGPSYVTNCYFDKFQNLYYNDSFKAAYGFRPVRPAAAINFHPNNHYPMVPRNGVKGLRFGFCDGVDDSFRVMDGNASTPWWYVYDGTLNTVIRDYDGSLTGTKGAMIVKDRPFFTGKKCQSKHDWKLAVCPYSYTRMVVSGGPGVLMRKYRGKTPVYISRDDHPEDVYIQSGHLGHKYLLRAYTSYTVKFNSHLSGAPRTIRFRPQFGLEKNELVRIAVCLPKFTNRFIITSRYPELHPRKRKFPIWVDNLQTLDDDTTMKAFYWDKKSGYLYFKMRSPYSFTRPGQKCAGDVCLEVAITRVDGGSEPAVCDSYVKPWVLSFAHLTEDYFSTEDRDSSIKADTCNPKTDLQTAEGLGAPIETGFSPPAPDSENCNKKKP